jgi:hypothetical protein
MFLKQSTAKGKKFILSHYLKYTWDLRYIEEIFVTIIILCKLGNEK